MQQRVNEIRAKPEGDDKTDQWVRHGGALQPVAKNGVGTHQSESTDAKGQKNEIEHDKPSCIGTGDFDAPNIIKIRYGRLGADIKTA